jgi:ankyrin repeat protein
MTAIRLVALFVGVFFLAGCGCDDTVARRELDLNAIEGAPGQSVPIAIDTSQLPQAKIDNRVERKDGCGNPITELTIFSNVSIKVVLVPVTQPAQPCPASNTANGPTPIALAAYNGNTGLVAKLLQEDRGRLADQSFGAKMTLVAVAASQGRAATVSFLLRAGLNPNIPDQSGATPLSFAALSSGSAGAIDVLLKGGANPNASNIQGETPLHYAAVSGKLAVAKLIVAAGGDPTIKDLKGQTPADLAQSDGFPDLATYLKGKQQKGQKPLSGRSNNGAAQQEPATKPTYVNTSAFIRDYRASHYLQCAVELDHLDPASRAARLREIAMDLGRASELFPLCRMLFEAKGGAEFRGPLIGSPVFVDGGRATDWPLEPIAIRRGVPILVVTGYVLGGEPESPQSYLKYCLAECKWREAKNSNVDNSQIRAVIEEFIASSPKLADRAEWLRQQAR